MKVTVRLDNKVIKGLQNAAKSAACDTLEQVYTKLVSSKTMPFDTGDMQNNQTFVVFNLDSNSAVLITNSPQARRLYYHPEYNFQTGKNHNAGAYWLEPYISGDKKDFIRDKYTELFRKRAGL